MHRIYPWEYTDVDGGEFKVWTFGPVSVYSLSKRGKTVYINGICVHSLIFESATAGLNAIPRWDSINGWTNSIKNAKRHWPEGLHGKKNKYNERRNHDR